jgi:hypothetical protein
MKKSILIIVIMLCQFAIAQEFTFRGIATENDMPLPGATIVIAGTMLGTSSDFDGIYSLKVRVGDVIEISYVGMETISYRIKFSDYEKSLGRTENSNFAKKDIVQNIESDDFKLATNKIDSIKPTESSGKMTNFFYNSPRFDLIRYGTRYKQKLYDDLPTLNLTFSTEIILGKPIRLYNFQNTYSQGISMNNQWQYQSPETNEIFSWGSPINQLSIGNNQTPYYPDGAIESNIFGGTVPTFNQNIIFSNTYQLVNNLTLKFKIDNKQSFDLKLANQKFFNIFSMLQNDIFDASLGYLYQLKNHQLKTHFNFYSTLNHLNNGNFLVNKMIFSNAITPTHFNSKLSTLLTNGTQRNFTNAYNNPYFLLQNINDIENSRQTSLFIEDKYQKYGVKNSISYQGYISVNNQQFGQTPQTVGFISGNLNKRKENFIKNVLNNNFEWQIDNDEGFVLSSNTEFIHENRKINRDFIGFINANDFPNNGSIFSNFINERNRLAINQTFGLKYDLKEFFDLYKSFTIEARPSFVYSTTLNKNIAFNSYASLEYKNILNYFDVFFSHLFKQSEPSLQQNNLSFNSLNFQTSQINLWQNNQELTLPNSFIPTIYNGFNLILNKNNFHQKIGFNLRLYYENVKNEYTPVLVNQQFQLIPAFDFIQRGIELSINKNIIQKDKLKSSITLNFETFNNHVTRVIGDVDRLPYAGFQDVSKNYMVNQPIGIIVGSKYVRNEKNQMIIGDDGFPLIADGLHVLGKPNADFISSIINNWSYKNWHFSYTLQYQQGGTLWDGTQQTMNYFGVSRQTAIDRNVSNYIFEGVNQNGQTNTTPVQLYNPQLPVENNKWVRNGFSGVTEDGIVDASYLNLNEITLAYKTTLNKSKQPFDLKIQFFVNNIFLWTKNQTAIVNQQMFDGSETTQLNFFNTPLVQSYGLNFSLNF